MCTAINQQDTIDSGGKRRDASGKRIPTPLQVGELPLTATDVPLGDGFLDAASLSLRSRRNRISDAERPQ